MRKKSTSLSLQVEKITMAPGNGPSHKTSRMKKKALPEVSLAPVKVDVLLMDISVKPADLFHAAAKKYTSSHNCTITLCTLWDLTLEIGQKRFSEEMVARDLAKD